VASAIGLLAVSATNSKISSAKGTTAMLMLVAGIISLVAVGAVLMSWKKVTWYLHMYEFACLVVLVLLVLVLIGTAMTNSNSASSTATCTSPTNYF
jgi:cell division protein FtsW (lipid II flippase)